MNNKELNLHNLISQNATSRDLFHDLMLYRVREILLVASMYDSYIIEREGQVSEQIFEEYFQLNISHAPRITSVTSTRVALKKLKKRYYGLVILMMGLDKETPFELSKEIKKINHRIPVLLLLNNSSDIIVISKEPDKLKFIDKTFVWNGDSRIFLGMVKYIEDKKNVKRDTKKGLVKVILLVEDSIRYYSRYLPTLYTVLMKQTQSLISEEIDQFDKLLRMRARSKVLLANNYEEALEIYNRYKDDLLCVISDVKYSKGGKTDKEAGLKLIEHIKRESPELPTLIQSSDTINEAKAYQLKSSFIDKNSDQLVLKLRDFFLQNLGFGSFIFKNENGEAIASAHNLEEFENILEIVSNSSLCYHANRDHFSTWMLARGEVRAAKKLKVLKVSDFDTPDEIRDLILEVIKKERNEKRKGEVIGFRRSEVDQNCYIVRLSNGSLGGKGRGLAFISHLISVIDFQELLPDINISFPRTAIIGTDEFDRFIDENGIHKDIGKEYYLDMTKERFLKGEFSEELLSKLKLYLKRITKPIAVRSSGLFEDSLLHPFSGVYTTYLIPNNETDIEIRLKKLTDAIKLVYFSVFSPIAKQYFDAVNFKIEEEKMAVIIQEVVGDRYDDLFYPHISGIAQSYNFYPFSYMKPEDGLSVIAVGLGKYVVEGEQAFRFCPRYPALEMLTIDDQFSSSQRKFYAIDMKPSTNELAIDEGGTLKKVEISRAEKDGTLNHCASVFDIRNNRIIPGITKPGPRIVNFANIIKYNYIPLAKTVDKVLNIVQQAMFSPVEIEFAIDLNKDKNGKTTFYLLQIKPLIKGEHLLEIDLSLIDKDKIFLYTEQGMGNGKVENIKDIIYIDHSKFDKSKTLDMVKEIEKLNLKMRKENKQYILMGPGRWGSSDRWLGVPVVWTQISQAKIIVETTIQSFVVDASLGSHFFHNITSMNVGYFTVRDNEDYEDYVKWDIIKSGTLIEETQYFKHVEFSEPLTVLMDGKKGTSIISLHQKYSPEERDDR